MKIEAKKKVLQPQQRFELRPQSKRITDQIGAILECSAISEECLHYNRDNRRLLRQFSHYIEFIPSFIIYAQNIEIALDKSVPINTYSAKSLLSKFLNRVIPFAVKINPIEA